MAVNFNYSSRDKDYQLFRRQTEELINLYGVICKYLKVQKLNKDAVFGEFTKIKADKDSVFNIAIMPEQTEGWGGQDLFGKFGLQVLDQMNFFIAANTFELLYEDGDFNNCVGDILVFENGKYMEITSLDTEVAGGNNLFTSSALKNVYMLKTRSYQFNRDSQIDIPEEDMDFAKIDAMFLGETPVETKNDSAKVMSTRRKKKSDPVFGDL
jgi:hypothetical protein